MRHPAATRDKGWMDSWLNASVCSGKSLQASVSRWEHGQDERGYLLRRMCKSWAYTRLQCELHSSRVPKPCFPWRDFYSSNLTCLLPSNSSITAQSRNWCPTTGNLPRICCKGHRQENESWSIVETTPRRLETDIPEMEFQVSGDMFSAHLNLMCVRPSTVLGNLRLWKNLSQKGMNTYRFNNYYSS